MSGLASLSGTMEVDLVNGFVPRVGDKFTFLTAGDGIGAGFTKFTSNDSLLVYNVDYGSGKIVEITVASVPEPVGLWMVGVSVGLGLKRRRSRRTPPTETQQE